MGNPLMLVVQDIIDLTNKTCAEIGVRDGSFSKAIFKCHPKHLYLIDCWEKQDPSVYNDPSNVEDAQQKILFETVHKRFDQHNKIVTIIKDFSLNAVKQFDDNFFDFIYIDANHSTDALYADMKAWWPKIKIGGWMTGHDYTSNWSSVIKAVKMFSEERELKVLRLTRDSWGLVKNDQ